MGDQHVRLEVISEKDSGSVDGKSSFYQDNC